MLPVNQKLKAVTMFMLTFSIIEKYFCTIKLKTVFTEYYEKSSILIT